MTQKPLKPKKCKVCGAIFAPSLPMQRVCGPSCAYEHSRKLKQREAEWAAREERKAHRAAKERIKTRGEHLREAQAAFNAWIRARDAGQPCISCGRHHQGQLHAGHYRSVRSEPALRFEPDNCHLQCAPCNTHLSGNLVMYRKNLIEKIGLERVEWLEGPHEAKKLTVSELEEMKAFYRLEVRRLKREEHDQGRGD